MTILICVILSITISYAMHQAFIGAYRDEENNKAERCIMNVNELWAHFHALQKDYRALSGKLCELETKVKKIPG